MCSGRLQCRPQQDFDEPGSNSRNDHYRKLGFGGTDRSTGRGNMIPAAVSSSFRTSRRGCTGGPMVGYLTEVTLYPVAEIRPEVWAHNRRDRVSAICGKRHRDRVIARLVGILQSVSVKIDFVWHDWRRRRRKRPRQTSNKDRRGILRIRNANHNMHGFGITSLA